MIPGLLKVDCVMYRVTDLKKSSEFYADVLGLKKVWTDKKLKMVGFKLKKSDAEIVIHQDKTIPNPDFSFLVKNVVESCRFFQKNGAKILKKPTSVRCGKFALVADPNGNPIPIIDLTKFKGKARYD